MKRIVFLAALVAVALSATGCNSCGRSRWNCFNWFNRGDACDDCNSGMPRGAMFAPNVGPYGAPAGPEYLPGPASTQIIN